MKKYTSLVLLLTCIFSVGSVFGAEAEISVAAVCDNVANSVLVSGKVISGKEKQVFIQVVHQDNDAIYEEDIAALKSIMTSTMLEDGLYTKNIILPQGFPNGNYRVSVFCDGISSRAMFSYLNLDNIQTLLEKGLSDKPTTDEMKNFLNRHASDLLLDPVLVENSKSFVGEVVAKRYSVAEKTAARFLRLLNGAFAAYEIKNGTDIGDVFSQYLGGILEYHNDYQTLRESVQLTLVEKLKTADYTLNDFDAVYRTYQGVAQLRNAQNYVEVAQYILTNYQSLGIDLSTYNSKSTSYEKDSIMQEMYANRRNIHHGGDIQRIFEDACSSLTPQNPISGGSHGGGGGVSTTLVVEPPEIPKVPNQPTTPFFYDTQGHWAQTQIAALLQRGILSGYEDQSFRPENKVNRAEFVKMISEAFSIHGTEQAKFADVAADDWFAPYVGRLVQSGIVVGSDGKFYPQDPVSREQAAVILYRTLEKKGKTFAGEEAFADNAQIAHYAKQAVGALAAAEILNGYEQNMFLPQNHLTRAEAATVLYNALFHFYDGGLSND